MFKLISLCIKLFDFVQKVPLSIEGFDIAQEFWIGKSSHQTFQTKSSYCEKSKNPKIFHSSRLSNGCFQETAR